MLNKVRSTCTVLDQILPVFYTLNKVRSTFTVLDQILHVFLYVK
jgi:hypothetical protein